MPYTSEELRDIDFYAEFLNKKERAYLERVTRSAYNGFKRDDGALVSYEAIDNGLGFEDANLETSGVYSTFISALNNNAGVQLLNTLNEDYVTAVQEITNSPGASAETIGIAISQLQSQGIRQYGSSDVPTYIRELASGKSYYQQQPEYIKTTNLESIIDRSISELSQTSFAETLPDGIENGDVLTNEFADDFRKWLIENNQKRIFPDMATFYGTVIEWGDIKSLPMAELNNIPNGEPVD